MKTDTAPPPWYRQFWPWFLIALPMTTVLGGIATIVIAVAHHDSLVSDNYYKEGLAINRSMDMDRAALQQQLGASAVFSGTAVKVELHGRPQQQPARLQLALQHPLRAEEDIELTLIRHSETGYAATLAQPLRGRRYLELSDGAGQWRLRGLVDPHGDGSAAVEVRADDR